MSVKKKILLTVLSAVLVIMLAAGATMAFYHSRTSTKNNEFASPPGKVEIVENFTGWDVKEVQLKNASEKIPGVVRAMLIPRVVDAAGNYILSDLAPLTAPADGKIVMGDFTFELASGWEDNWFYKDGFFYCKKVLEAGETSPKLLQKVSLTSDTAEVRAKYKDLKIKADVLADILQAEGGAPEAEWGVKVNGTVVSAA